MKWGVGGGGVLTCRVLMFLCFLSPSIVNELVFFALGDEQVVLSSAERYNPQKDTWRNITPMEKKRAGLALVAFDG
jgi:hypothetical protein